MISIDNCINDSLQKLSPQHFGNHKNSTVNFSECSIYVWPQIWSDASCGDNCGFSAQAITKAPTVVIIGPMSDACVYHGGKFAYKIDKVDEEFWSWVENKDMPGKEDFLSQKV